MPSSTLTLPSSQKECPTWLSLTIAQRTKSTTPTPPLNESPRTTHPPLLPKSLKTSSSRVNDQTHHPRTHTPHRVHGLHSSSQEDPPGPTPPILEGKSVNTYTANFVRVTPWRPPQIGEVHTTTQTQERPYTAKRDNHNNDHALSHKS